MKPFYCSYVAKSMQKSFFFFFLSLHFKYILGFAGKKKKTKKPPASVLFSFMLSKLSVKLCAKALWDRPTQPVTVHRP